jgi:hypothetical protein
MIGPAGKHPRRVRRETECIDEFENEKAAPSRRMVRAIQIPRLHILCGLERKDSLYCRGAGPDAVMSSARCHASNACANIRSPDVPFSIARIAR